MEDLRSRYRRLFVTGSNTDRLVFFSDAVFAIAMTLLVIDLHVPEAPTGDALEVISSQLGGLFAYALSFTIIALNWMSHHRKFRVIETHDGTLMFLDLALLFVVAFVPFPTSLLSTFGGEKAAVVLYAFTVGLLGVLQFAIWTYAYRRGLVSREVTPAMNRYITVNQLSTPIVFWATIPIALFWDGTIAMYAWFLLFPVGRIGGLIQRRIARRADAAEQSTAE